MTEEFLHYIWQFKLYNPHLKLVSGESLDVLQAGIHNTDAGPDFFNARIRIEDTVWAGNIEIHILSSDWEKHRHHHDKLYDNVILHVVWMNDKPVFRNDGLLIPTLELHKVLNSNAWNTYLDFMNSRNWIPCEKQIAQIDKFIFHSWLDRLLIERLERKALDVEHIFALTNNNWTHTFYRLLAANMGFKVNNLAFELLAGSLPYQFLFKHADNLFQLEAMIFGQAGLLKNDFKDEYPRKLKKEYAFLRGKFEIEPIDGTLWRFMRLHPGNFPTLRLAQFAAIIHRSQSLLTDIIDSQSVSSFHDLFSANASEYWETHYTFDNKSALKVKKLGTTAIDLLIINLVAPILVAYNRRRTDYEQLDKPFEFLTKVNGENNKITRKWLELSVAVPNAAASQALIELKTKYCDAKKCLSCRIGKELLK